MCCGQVSFGIESKYARRGQEFGGNKIARGLMHGRDLQYEPDSVRYDWSTWYTVVEDGGDVLWLGQ